VIFRKQTFLGQVPLSQQRITSGASTFTAQNLCRLLKQESAKPGSATQKIADEWSRVSGVKEMEDEVYGWMDTWCPQFKTLLGFTVAKAAGLQRPVPPPPITPTPPPGTPVVTPGGGQRDYTACFQCGPNQYRMMMPQDAAATGCTAVDMSKCQAPPPISTRPPVPSTYKRPKMLYGFAPVGEPPPITNFPPVATRSAFTAPPTPAKPLTRRGMTREEIIRAALTMPGSGSGITPITYSPTTYAQMPMMNGPRRLRVMNLGGSNEDLAWFEANRVQLAQQYPGQYVIIKDLAVRGAYPDFQSAYNAGVAMFGTQPFEVKQAVAEQRVEHA